MVTVDVHWVARNMVNVSTISVAVTLALQAKGASSRRVQTSVSTTASACVGNATVIAVTRAQTVPSASWYTARATVLYAHASATQLQRNLLHLKIKCG